MNKCDNALTRAKLSSLLEVLGIQKLAGASHILCRCGPCWCNIPVAECPSPGLGAVSAASSHCWAWYRQVCYYSLSEDGFHRTQWPFGFSVSGRALGGAGISNLQPWHGEACICTKPLITAAKEPGACSPVQSAPSTSQASLCSQKKMTSPGERNIVETSWNNQQNQLWKRDWQRIQDPAL